MFIARRGKNELELCKRWVGTMWISEYGQVRNRVAAGIITMSCKPTCLICDSSYFDEIHIGPTQRCRSSSSVFPRGRDEHCTRAIRNRRKLKTMITGDLNTALVPWVVQYRITDPKMYLFGAREPEKTLRDLSESVMREVIGDRTVDEVLTIGRHDIETSTLKRLADLCSQYDLGIQIQQVQLTSVRRRRRFRRIQ